MVVWSKVMHVHATISDAWIGQQGWNVHICGRHMRGVSTVICTYGMYICGGMYDHISHGCAVHNV